MPKSIQKFEPTLPINTYLVLFIFKFINTPSVRLQRLSGSQETVGWGPDPPHQKSRKMELNSLIFVEIIANLP